MDVPEWLEWGEPRVPGRDQTGPPQPPTSGAGPGAIGL